jgi:hypothetical protein
VKPRNFEVSSEVFGLDTERILGALARHGVDYVLVGGLAALAHGSTIATADADVLPSTAPENLERLLDALEELEAMILVGERRLAMEAGQVWEATELNTKGADAIVGAEAWHFTTSAGPLDVVVSVTGVGAFDVVAARSEQRGVFDVRIQVAAIEDLIASKEATGRPKDEAILRELREIREGADGPT